MLAVLPLGRLAELELEMPEKDVGFGLELMLAV